MMGADATVRACLATMFSGCMWPRGLVWLCEQSIADDLRIIVRCHRGRHYGMAFMDVQALHLDPERGTEAIRRVGLEALRRTGWVPPWEDRHFRIATRGAKRNRFAAQRGTVDWLTKEAA